MAIDLAPHGIKVDSVAPTFIETPMTAGFFADVKFREAVVSKIKLGRVEDIMGAIVFLASDAASLMTGSAMWSIAAGRQTDRYREEAEA